MDNTLINNLSGVEGRTGMERSRLPVGKVPGNGPSQAAFSGRPEGVPPRPRADTVERLSGFRRGPNDPANFSEQRLDAAARMLIRSRDLAQQISAERSSAAFKPETEADLSGEIPPGTQVKEGAVADGRGGGTPTTPYGIQVYQGIQELI